MVNQNSELDGIKRQLQRLEIQSLESKYPGISSHADEIMALHKKANGALTIAEIYQAKFSKLTDKDIKTKTEQEMIYRQQQASKKKIADGKGSEKPKVNVKLSPSEERAYQLLIKNKNFKGTSREEFKKSMLDDSVE